MTLQLPGTTRNGAVPSIASTLTRHGQACSDAGDRLNDYGCERGEPACFTSYRPFGASACSRSGRNFAMSTRYASRKPGGISPRTRDAATIAAAGARPWRTAPSGLSATVWRPPPPPSTGTARRAAPTRRSRPGDRRSVPRSRNTGRQFGEARASGRSLPADARRRHGLPSPAFATPRVCNSPRSPRPTDPCCDNRVQIPARQEPPWRDERVHSRPKRRPLRLLSPRSQNAPPFPPPNRLAASKTVSIGTLDVRTQARSKSWPLPSRCQRHETPLSRGIRPYRPGRLPARDQTA